MNNRQRLEGIDNIGDQVLRGIYRNRIGNNIGEALASDDLRV
jgi:hypothetical protein